MTWLALDPSSGFGLDHLPYGSAMVAGRPRVVVRVGNQALDLTVASEGTTHETIFASGTLDGLLAAGRPVWDAVRASIVEWLSDPAHRSRIEPWLMPLDGLDLRLSFAVADYVDFYASEHHATNVGRLFRPDGQALTPNWKHLPIGYHGRAGTIVVSGTEIVRPSGQSRAADGSIGFGPSQRLDIEAEVGFVVGTGSSMGTPVPLADFRDHVFGLCLLNDWSARDIQSWESVPLGPFLGKSFGTSVSAWVTPLAALDDAWIAPPARSPQPLPYLDDAGIRGGLDLALEVRINGSVVSRPPFSSMYWTPAQMLAHLTVNGASLRPGDLFASGTVSGPEVGQRGCLLELTWNGTAPVAFADGRQLGFLEDGDEVVITASAPSAGRRITLGEVRGRVVSR